MRFLFVLPFVFLALLAMGTVTFGTQNVLSGLETEVESTWKVVEGRYTERAKLVRETLGVIAETNTLRKVGVSKVTRALSDWEVAKLAKAERVVMIPLAKELDVATEELFDALNKNASFKNTVTYKNLRARQDALEKALSTERHKYNFAVEAYNERIGSFPTTLGAWALDFSSEPSFAGDSSSSDPEQF